jgi:hypothetical protein
MTDGRVSKGDVVMVDVPYLDATHTVRRPGFERSRGPKPCKGEATHRGGSNTDFASIGTTAGSRMVSPELSSATIQLRAR